MACSGVNSTLTLHFICYTTEFWLISFHAVEIEVPGFSATPSGTQYRIRPCNLYIKHWSVCMLLARTHLTQCKENNLTVHCCLLRLITELPIIFAFGLRKSSDSFGRWVRALHVNVNEQKLVLGWAAMHFGANLSMLFILLLLKHTM